MKMNKKCNRCQQEKTLDDFHNRSDSPDGKRHQCKDCKREVDKNCWQKYKDTAGARNKKYKENNKSSVLKKCRKYKRDHRESVMLDAARKRAKSRGLDFDLSVEDIQIPDRCPLLDIKLCFNGVTNNRDSSPSIDRIDSQKGYVKGNIRVISYRANRIKNNATPEELKRIAERIDDYSRPESQDDSTDQIKSITFESRQSDEEKTVLEITDE